MKHTVWILLAFLALPFSACSDDEAAPHDVSDILALTGNVSLGQGQFTKSCGTSACHGATGDDGMGGKLSERVPLLTESQLADTIRYGTDTPANPASMPPQGDTEGGTLTAQQIANVIAFLEDRFVSGGGGAGGN